jgi:hypothetical protein
LLFTCWKSSSMIVASVYLFYLLLPSVLNDCMTDVIIMLLVRSWYQELLDKMILVFLFTCWKSSGMIVAYVNMFCLLLPSSLNDCSTYAIIMLHYILVADNRNWWCTHGASSENHNSWSWYLVIRDTIVIVISCDT